MAPCTSRLLVTMLVASAARGAFAAPNCGPDEVCSAQDVEAIEDASAGAMKVELLQTKAKAARSPPPGGEAAPADATPAEEVNPHAEFVNVESHFIGCFPRSKEDTDDPMVYEDVTCDSSKNYGEGGPCRSGLPFFRFALHKKQSYLDCFQFCLGKGLDIAGVLFSEKLDRDECRCGATKENQGVWGGKAPVPGLLLGEPVDSESEECKKGGVLAWKYTGGLEFDSVPTALVETTVDDERYIDGIVSQQDPMDVTEEEGHDNDVTEERVAVVPGGEDSPPLGGEAPPPPEAEHLAQEGNVLTGVLGLEQEHLAQLRTWQEGNMSLPKLEVGNLNRSLPPLPPGLIAMYDSSLANETHIPVALLESKSGGLCEDDPKAQQSFGMTCAQLSGYCHGSSATNLMIRSACPYSCKQCSQGYGWLSCFPKGCALGAPWSDKRSDGKLHINYFFSDRVYSDANRVAAFNKAIEEWESKTCVKFDYSSQQKPAVKADITNEGSCSSGVGNPGPTGDVSLNMGWCKEVSHWGTIAHELGHALGMAHEQNRADGAQAKHTPAGWKGPYLKIHWGQIDAAWRPQWEGKPATYIGSSSVGGWAPYDYGSMLHYGLGNNADIADGQNKAWKEATGQRDHLSDEDVKQFNDMYQCGGGGGGGGGGGASAASAASGCTESAKVGGYNCQQWYTAYGKDCASYTALRTGCPSCCR